MRGFEGWHLTKGLLSAVAGLLSGGNNGTIDPLQNEAHMVRVLTILGLARVAVFSEQPLLRSVNKNLNIRA